MDIFESPKFLISRASDNITKFESLCDIFFRENEGVQVVKSDPKTGDKLYKVVFNAPLPGEARHICASTIVDVRHSLDQLACAAFEAISKSPAPDNLYFPITNDLSDLKGRLAKDFPVELHSAFEALQPYPTSGDKTAGCDFLIDLNKAARGKHRISARIGGKVTSTHVSSMETKGVKELCLPFEWDVLNNELVLGRTSSDGYIRCKVHLLFHVALYDAGPLNGRPAGSTIREAISLAERFITEIEAATLRAI